MELSWILLSTLATLFFITWYFQQHKNLFSGIRRTLSSHQNANSVIQIIIGLFDSLGETFHVKDAIFTSMDYVFTCNPHNIEYVFKTNFSNFGKGTDFIQIVDIFGDGFFRIDSHLEQWLTGRKMLHSWFSSKDFRRFVADVSKREVEFALLPLLVHHAKERLMIDLQDVFLRLTTDNSFSLVFGRNPKLLSSNFPVDEFTEAMDAVMNTIVYRHVVPTTWWKLLRWLDVGWEGRESKARRTIDHIIKEMISLKKEEMVKGGEANDLLSKYLSSPERIDKDNCLGDNAFSAILAMGDTTASGLTWFFWLVSQTPRVEAKILDELSHTIHETSNTSKMKVFDQEELKNLVYLHAALCESLRLYPPVHINQRAAVKADVFPDGTKVRPGTKVIVSIYASARLKSTWGEDCMDFRPERWINENGSLRSEHMSKSFIFSVGPRSCMGKDIAFNSMKLVVAAILYNFHVEVVECEPESVKQSMVLFMKNGLRVKVRQRSC